MSSAHILLVEDDAPLRWIVGRALRGAGYGVEEAADGAQALRSLELKAPQLIVTDVLMPQRDGVELIIQAKKIYPGLPILAVSGPGVLGGLDVLQLAQSVGADAVLRKPFAVEQLFATVAQLLGGPPASG